MLKQHTLFRESLRWKKKKIISFFFCVTLTYDVIGCVYYTRRLSSVQYRFDVGFIAFKF